MFKKAKIDICNLELNDIIVTSEPLFPPETVFPGDGEMVDPET